jgi:ferredoxin-NADP reductase
MIHSKSELELVVVQRADLSSTVFEIEFEQVSGLELPDWQPGSHIDLYLSNGLVRQYSLIPGALSKRNWRIAVLVENQGKGGSLWLASNLQVGSKIQASNPKNHFKLEPAKEYLFIAGGIGITPLLRMILSAEEHSIQWQLKYLGSSLENMPYSHYLQHIYGEKVELFVKSQGSRLNLRESIFNVSTEAQIYCCGPERLMIAVEETLSESPERAHLERFHPREVVLTEPDKEFTVYCKKSDVELIVPADESILMAADFEGIDIPGDCMEGTCGSCETRVIQGEVDHRDSVLSAQARAEGDTMMICISRARGNRLVIDL